MEINNIKEEEIIDNVSLLKKFIFESSYILILPQKISRTAL
jgi:hypothetical protein